MAKAEMFRTVLIGGFNKADVLSYIEKLENELENMNSVKEKAAALEESITKYLEDQESKTQENMTSDQKSGETETAVLPGPEKQPEANKLPEGMSTEEFRELMEKAQKYDESYDAIKKLLLDSRIEAQVILTDARQKAEKILEDARVNGMLQVKMEEQKLLTDARAKADEIIQEAKENAKQRRELADQEIIKRVQIAASQAQEELKAIQASMQFIVDSLPARLELGIQKRLEAGEKAEVKKEEEKKPEKQEAEAHTEETAHG